MSKANVLFICVHNSARSRMAEGFLNARCGEFFDAQSAGLMPGSGVNPLAAEVMREVQIDITRNKSQEVFDVFKSGRLFAYVVTVCHESEAAGCPIFPGPTKRLHWPFADPSSTTGAWEEKLEKTRAIRDEIEEKIQEWCAEVCPESLASAGGI